MATPAPTQQQGPTEAEPPSKRPKLQDPPSQHTTDNEKRAMSQDVSPFALSIDQEEAHLLKQQKMPPTPSVDMPKHLGSQIAMLGSVGCSSIAGGAGTSTTYMPLTESRSLNSVLMQQNSLVMQQQQQQGQQGSVPASLAMLTPSLDLGDVTDAGQDIPGQGQQDRQQQQQQLHLNQFPAAPEPAAAAPQGAEAAAFVAMQTAVMPAVQPAAAAGVVAEAGAAGAVIDAAAAAGAVPDAVAAVLPAIAVAAVLPAAGAAQLAPVDSVDQFVARVAHAVAGDITKLYADGDVAVAAAAAAVNTASVGQPPAAAAAAAEAAALRIANQGNPAVVAAAAEAAQAAVFGCDILYSPHMCSSPLGASVVRVPDADVPDDANSDVFLSCYKHAPRLGPNGRVECRVEFWGLFPTWETAAEAANAAWLAHNLGLDNDDQVGSMLVIGGAGPPVSNRVAALVGGPHFFA